MRIVPWLLTVLICFSVTAGLAGIKYLQISAAMAMAESFPPPFAAITAHTATKSQWTPVRRLTGSVRAPEFVSMTAEATGRVVALPVAAGAVVQEGDVVFQLFDEDLKAQRTALLADLDLVKVQLKRVQKLKQDSLASQDQLDTLLARSQSLQAQIAATDAQLSRLTVRAPFTGRLGIYDLSVGDLLNTGDTLTTLTGIGDTRWIDFKIPQGVARVTVGDTVRVISIDEGLVGEARIIAVADALSSGLRAFDVRAEIDDRRLRHGELVLVEVQTSDARSVFRLPRKSVRWDAKGPHVFVLKSSEPDAFMPYRAEMRRVTVHGESDGKVLITGDLSEGEKIAYEGAFKLNDGLLAKVVPAPGADAGLAL